MTYVVLYTNAQGYLATNSYSDVDDAKERIDELNKVNGVKSARLLTDYIDGPADYKELYMQLYNDFVKPQNTPLVTSQKPQPATVKD